MAIFMRWFRCSGCKRFHYAYGSTEALATQSAGTACLMSGCNGTIQAFSPPYDGWAPSRTG
jgi:hypothetical protein